MVLAAAGRLAGHDRSEFVVEAAAPAWASAAAVGHVQEKIVPIIIRVVVGDQCRFRLARRFAPIWLCSPMGR